MSRITVKKAFVDVMTSDCTHFWLRNTIEEFLKHDPVDALRNAEHLVALMEMWNDSGLVGSELIEARKKK